NGWPGETASWVVPIPLAAEESTEQACDGTANGGQQPASRPAAAPRRQLGRGNCLERFGTRTELGDGHVRDVRNRAQALVLVAVLLRWRWIGGGPTTTEIGSRHERPPEGVSPGGLCGLEVFPWEARPLPPIAGRPQGIEVRSRSG